MPIDTTIPPCLQCGTRDSSNHHSECPAVARELAYEASLNYYAELRFANPTAWTLRFANPTAWTIGGVPVDAPTPTPPPEERREGLFGLQRSTDATRLAGQRVSPTLESSAQILRSLYPSGEISAQVYSRQPGALADLWSREMRANTDRLTRELHNELVYGRVSPPPAPSEPTSPSMRTTYFTPPDRLASEEARILRMMREGHSA